MENNLPLSLRKYIQFIQNSSHWDSESGEPLYFQIVHKMDIYENMYENFFKKNGNVNNNLNEMCTKIQKNGDDFDSKVLSLAPVISGISKTKTNQKKLEARIALNVANYYNEIGNIIDEYGIIDVFVARSNNAFSKAGAPFFHCDRSMAIEEFDTRKNMRCDFSIIAMKLIFYINKIVKFVDALEYGAMLNNDIHKAKTGNDKRIKFFSKLKTDYLKKVIEAIQTMPEDEWKNFSMKSEEYNKIFEDVFENLNFEEDLANVYRYERCKENIYGNKGQMITNSLAGLISADKERLNREIRNWGIGKDKNGDFLMGMNLYGYPMPITVHVPKSSIENLLKCLKNDPIYGRERYIMVPKYNSLLDSNGSVFSTNVLFKAKEYQREKIKSVAENNPNNNCLKFFYSQIYPSRTENTDIEYDNIIDFL